MKLANFFILLLSFNLISVERNQLDVDFLSDDEYMIDLIFIKYLKDEDLKENFQNPLVNFERFFVALDEFQYPNFDIVPTNFKIPKENQSIDIPFLKGVLSLITLINKHASKFFTLYLFHIFIHLYNGTFLERLAKSKKVNK